MRRDYHRLLLLFVDGVGLAPADPSNPLAVEPTETLHTLLGGPLTTDSVQDADGLVLLALDACLGVDGLPQSATGQTALFTGRNGAALLGHHVTGFPGPRLRSLICESSLFLQVRDLGLDATFANAYTTGYLEAFRRGDRPGSVTTHAVLAADLPFRCVEELLRGEAVTWDIERDIFARKTGAELPPVTAREAGRHLVQLAEDHDLTVYETFITDLAGHGRFDVTPAEALRRVDGLLSGVVADKGGHTTVMVVSDHGNLEDDTDRTHTRNPVPLLALGPLAPRFGGLSSILEVTPRIVECLRR